MQSDAASPLTKGKPMNLREFLCKFQFHGSISCGGKKKIFKKVLNNDEWEVLDLPNRNKDEDYCALVLERPNLESELSALGLSYLEVGEDNYLEYNRKGIATIVGHPGKNATEKHEGGILKKPMRFSFGKEIDAKNLSHVQLHFDYDSVKGNSGSPVIGRGLKCANGREIAYKVKGIHINGEKKKSIIEVFGFELGTKNAYNGAQKLTKIDKWIDFAK